MNQHQGRRQYIIVDWLAHKWTKQHWDNGRWTNEGSCWNNRNNHQGILLENRLAELKPGTVSCFQVTSGHFCQIRKRIPKFYNNSPWLRLHDCSCSTYSDCSCSTYKCVACSAFRGISAAAHTETLQHIQWHWFLSTVWSQWNYEPRNLKFDCLIILGWQLVWCHQPKIAQTTVSKRQLPILTYGKVAVLYCWSHSC